MENMSHRKIWGAGVFVLWALGLFLVAQFINTVKSNKYIGAGVASANTISVSGKGEVKAVPDIATVYVTIREQGKDQKDASGKMASKERAVLSAIRNLGVDDKDIKTTSSSVNPQYARGPAVVCLTYPCPEQKQEIIGYEAYENLEVKVRKTEDAGKITVAVSASGAEFSGPNYALDDDAKYQDEARELAIKDAKEKAETLAKQLGVKIVRIASFSENGNYPMYYTKTEAAMSTPMGDIPEMPAGQNTITSNVNITYEIR